MVKRFSGFPLLGILLLAAALRLADLDGVPPGLQHDEVFHAHDAFTVRQGYTPLWFTSNAGNEPLFIYLMAGTTALFGDNVLGIRLTAVLCGLLTLVFTYQWGRKAFGRHVGLYAALFVALNFWSVWMSRVGLRAVSLPVLVALTGWLYTRAISRTQGESVGRAALLREAERFALAGLALGLTLYTYPAAFAAPLVFGAYYLYLALLERRALRRTPFGHLAFWLAAVLAYAPLGMALTRVEEGYLRVQQTAGPLKALLEGNPGPLLTATRDTLLMWTTRGDPLWRYNVTDRPVFGPPLAALFLLGVGVCLWHALLRPARETSSLGYLSKRSGYALVGLWLVIGVAPSAVTDSPPAFLRAAAALPATFLVLAVGLDSLRGLLIERIHLPHWAWGTVLVLAATLTGLATVRAYFGVWAHNEEVQRVYRSDLAEVANYLQTHAPPSGVAISTTEPHHLDRFIFDYTPHGEADIHWFDGLYALVFPAGEDVAWLFVTREPTPPQRLQGRYLDGARLIEERRFANGTLAFALYEVPGGVQALEQYPPPTGQGVWVSDVVAFPPNDLDGVRTVLAFPVQFDDVIQLVGYESEAVGHPGEWLRLTLTWRVTRDVDAPEPWAIFAHLLDAGGGLAAGRDFLAVPASTWRAGDVFVQLHDLPLPSDLSAGCYHLEIGLYSQADGHRFLVVLGGEAVGDRLLLEPVEIGEP